MRESYLTMADRYRAVLEQLLAAPLRRPDFVLLHLSALEQIAQE